MDCCVLHDSEAGRLINYNLPLNHPDHVHISSKEAITGILDGTYDLLEHRGRCYVIRTKTFFLQRKRSGYIDTIQRVKSNHLEHLKAVK